VNTPQLSLLRCGAAASHCKHAAPPLPLPRTILLRCAGDSGAVNVFGEPDILDDLLDHWTAADHVNERAMLVRRLQALAAAYSVRVTFLSGDVHVGAFGCFQVGDCTHTHSSDNTRTAIVGLLPVAALGQRPPSLPPNKAVSSRTPFGQRAMGSCCRPARPTDALCTAAPHLRPQRRAIPSNPCACWTPSSCCR
jgi:hypothetical protein